MTTSALLVGPGAGCGPEELELEPEVDTQFIPVEPNPAESGSDPAAMTEQEQPPRPQRRAAAIVRTYTSKSIRRHPDVPSNSEEEPTISIED